MIGLRFRPTVVYSARQTRTSAGPSNTDRLPSKRENRRTLQEAASVAVSPPASLVTRRQRDLDRFYGAVDNVWNRDQGQHRRELRALIALVDANQIALSDAIQQVTELDARTARHAA